MNEPEPKKGEPAGVVVKLVKLAQKAQGDKRPLTQMK